MNPNLPPDEAYQRRLDVVDEELGELDRRVARLEQLAAAGRAPARLVAARLALLDAHLRVVNEALDEVGGRLDRLEEGR